MWKIVAVIEKHIFVLLDGYQESVEIDHRRDFLGQTSPYTRSDIGVI
jgi:hypothetical protein